ncbi:MAG: helix-turn-helix domain-containing protein [Actinobacteria bacterium]|nr:helix-turn-helix domain-containing protein [Actinomycetota bacterium]
MTPGELIRATRLAHGLTQRELAFRAGTAQTTLSRIERNAEQVTWPRLRAIMLAMGEEPVLGSRPLAHQEHPRDIAWLAVATPGTRIEGALNVLQTAQALQKDVQRRTR